MPRYTRQAWWCWMGHRNEPQSRQCSECSASLFEKHAQIHQNDRAVVYYNPATGEHRTPPRADMAMPEQYASAGFERREILSMVSWEKEAGVIHEDSNFHAGNEVIDNSPPAYKPKPEVVHKLARELGEALSTSDWSGHEKLEKLESVEVALG